MQDGSFRLFLLEGCTVERSRPAIFFDSDHSILRITLSCSQAKWLTGSPMDLAQRVRRAIFIVAEKHTRRGRLGQCAVA